MQTNNKRDPTSVPRSHTFSRKDLSVFSPTRVHIDLQTAKWENQHPLSCRSSLNDLERESER